MSKKAEDLSKLSLSEVMERCQEMEAIASYYKGKVQRIETRKLNKINKERFKVTSSNFPNNPISQPEPCEETKLKLFGNQAPKTI